MSDNQQIEWLNLVEKTGPFLAVGVLAEEFKQGLEAVATPTRQRVRSAYDEWRDAIDAEDAQLSALHREWLKLILEELLEYDASVLKSGAALPAALSYRDPISGVEVRPDFAVMAGDATKLLIATYPPDRLLTGPTGDDAWLASPVERMTQLCRATGTRIGLVTNGERWTLVSVPEGGASSVATWFARIWQQEPVTLQAFVSLLGVRRCFAAGGTLESLLTKSLEHQNDVTDTLGEQVRRAVEVLVQALDRADLDRNRQLLKEVSPAQLYEAGLTVMMRLVVILCAEERGLLLLGEPTYDQHYAVSTLRGRLIEDKNKLGEEVLERRHDAWSRLLAVFRAVFGGIEHETLRLPPLGGSLFDPDRFPFLEGRALGTAWQTTPAAPLPIDNRTVLMLLTALQVLEQKSGAQLLSYEALDVEQIGHVYEGLLERTVKRVPEVTLGIIGSQKVINPTLPLRELEEAMETGVEAAVAKLVEATERSAAALKKALAKAPDDTLKHQIELACDNDGDLAERVMPFAQLLRADTWGHLLVYPKDAFIVTMGANRRETGTHYTPKSLTEPIVQHTLEPLVYTGPAEGLPREKWKLKSPAELLALKICDMAMGSAAFLVQACRWLAERVVESWAAEEKAGRFISIEGVVLDAAGAVELLPHDNTDRILIARRLVASRCLYGVDINPMAVELGKVSLWLVTMMKGRPFGFVDHALKCGDSLLGVSSIQQIENFSLRHTTRQTTFATASLARYVNDAANKRLTLENIPTSNSIQIDTKRRLHAEAELATSKVKALADAVLSFELLGLDGIAYNNARESAADKARLMIEPDTSAPTASPCVTHQTLNARRTFHWPLEFPEVFNHGGFNAITGNPPWFFLSGKANPVARLRRLGKEVEADDLEKEIASYTSLYPESSIGAKDYYKWFVARGVSLIKEGDNLGLVLSNSFISLPRYRDVRNQLIQFSSLFVFDLGFGYFDAVVACAVVVGVKKTSANQTKPAAVFVADLKLNKIDALAALRDKLGNNLEPIELLDGDFQCFKSAFADCAYGTCQQRLGDLIDIREGHHDLSFKEGAVETLAIDDRTLSKLSSPKMARGWLPVNASGLDAHKGDRFLIRKTGDSLIAATVSTSSQAIAHQNVYVCKPKNDIGLSAKAICALIASSCCSRLYQDGPLGQKGRPMAQLRIIGIKQIPVPPIGILVAHKNQLESAYDNGASEVDALSIRLYEMAFPKCTELM